MAMTHPLRHASRDPPPPLRFAPYGRIRPPPFPPLRLRGGEGPRHSPSRDGRRKRRPMAWWRGHRPTPCCASRAAHGRFAFPTRRRRNDVNADEMRGFRIGAVTFLEGRLDCAHLVSVHVVTSPSCREREPAMRGAACATWRGAMPPPPRHRASFATPVSRRAMAWSFSPAQAQGRKRRRPYPPVRSEA